MGEQKVSLAKTQTDLKKFVRGLLDDLQALEHMLEHDWFETDIVRIGAEQEMCIVDSRTYKPAKINMDVIKRMKDYPWLDTELAQFNLETNMTPHEFKGDCLRLLENENLDYLKKIRQTVKKMGASIALTGILPTLRKSDLDLENLTPKLPGFDGRPGQPAHRRHLRTQPQRHRRTQPETRLAAARSLQHQLPGAPASGAQRFRLPLQHCADADGAGDGHCR
jgi:hypothetical protein